MRTLSSLISCASSLLGGYSSSAEQAIISAKEAIAKTPDKPDSYLTLSAALVRWARETGFGAFLTEAETAVGKILQLQPDHFVALRTRVSILLARHDYPEALKLATALQKKTPDDVLVYGLLSEAHRELGNYKEAEESAQWTLDMGRSSAPGLVVTAELRYVFGDTEGALDLIRTLYARTDPSQADERAWLLTKTGQWLLSSGKHEEASQALNRALEEIPEFHLALRSLAAVHVAQGKYEKAVPLLRRWAQTSGRPECLFELAVALRGAGNADEANALFAEFEQKAKAVKSLQDNANLQLMEYYSDYADKPAEALGIAEIAIAQRRDVHTLDAYAWALFLTGRMDEARSQTQLIHALGIREPKIISHYQRVTGEH